MSKPLEFYQLERAPFEDGVRDAAAVGTRPLRAALERTRRSIEAETRVVCLGGRAGVGKTYFGLALPSVLPAGARIARLGQPGQPWSVVHAAIARGFDLDPASFSVDALHELRETGIRLVIEIDPIEQMQPDTFPSLLSLLSHAYLPGQPLVQAVLIGDFATLPDTAREGLTALGANAFELEPLPDGDVPSYIQKRLDRAGYRGQPLFSRAAAEEIRRCADGVPREINRICARALEVAAAQRAQVIEPDVIREACGALATQPGPATAPAAVPPRAVIGQLKLKARSVANPAPAPTPGQPRRIEPLPPEPLVEAELETPLMDAKFVDDGEPVSAQPLAPSAPTVQSSSPAAVAIPTPERVVASPPRPVVAERAPATAPAAAALREPTPMRVAVETALPTPAPSALESAPAIGAGAPKVEAPAPTARVAARGAGRLPWVHMTAGLIAAWAVAAGVLWIHAQPGAPQLERDPPASSAAAALTPSAIQATVKLAQPSAELLTRAEMAVPDASGVPAAAPVPDAAPVRAPIEMASTPSALGPAPRPEPQPVAPSPARGASDASSSAPSPAAAAAIASAAAAAAPAAAPPPPTRAAAPPPLRVELRSRGREILYPPRPASAYAMPLP